MMKSEFCNLVKKDVDEISDAEWETVSLVYLYHPVIPEVSGKEVIAEIYRISPKILLEMVDRAQKIREIDDKKREITKRFNETIKSLEEEENRLIKI